MPYNYRFSIGWTIAWSVCMAAVIGATMSLTDGKLILALDDPYIHLAVAENILKGHYGINLSEASSPSSSILYPLLLAALGAGPASPLIINLAATAASVWLTADFLRNRVFTGARGGELVFANVCTLFGLLSLSALALPMTGMEHSLHVLLVVLCLRGVVDLADGKKPTALFLATVIALPLVRLEGTAMAGAAIIILFALGFGRQAVAVVAVIVSCLIAYAATMTALDLPIVPSSVLTKSAVSASVYDDGGAFNTLRQLLGNIKTALDHRWGIIYALATCICLGEIIAWWTRRGSRRDPDMLVAFLMAATLSAHIVAGKYGWLARYEVYATALLVLGGLFLLRNALDHVNVGWKVAAVLVLAITILPYVIATGRTPLASKTVYEQQYQMHRFATEFFPHGVAVNDLGWVSYQNDGLVLDLWGLGSERARKARLAGAWTKEAVQDLATEYDVAFAMVYEDWLGSVMPSAWCHVAQLHAKTSAGVNEHAVDIYLADLSRRDEMAAALDRFGTDLPDGVSLFRFSCAS